MASSKVTPATLDEAVLRKAIRLCLDQRSRSYCPYSKFAVGCVVVLDDGTTLIPGCNVENSSFGLCICAERTAICTAVSQGFHKYRAVFVGTSTDFDVWPCGACLQFISEFGLDIVVYAVRSDESYVARSVRELLPYCFTPDRLPT